MTGLIETWRGRGGRAPGPPDYVGVGTLWAGVGWWHSMLLRHPDVERRRRRRRSLFFFQPFCERPMTEADADRYRRAFWRRPGRLDGEWSQRYMFDHWTPPLLHQVAPDARLLVLLSNPVDRYREKLAIERRRRPPDEVAYYLTEILTRGRYATQLRQLWKYYDPQSTLVLQYEQCRSAPLEEYARTLRFLGLDEDCDPFSGWRSRAAGAAGALVTRLRPQPDPAELWPDLQQELHAELEAEMLDLQRLVPEIDLALWPDFADLATRPEPVSARA